RCPSLHPGKTARLVSPEPGTQFGLLTQSSPAGTEQQSKLAMELRTCYGVVLEPAVRSPRRLRSANVKILSHLAVLLIPCVQERLRWLVRQHRQLRVQHVAEHPRRLFMIHMSATLRLRDDFVYYPQVFQVARRNLHRCGRCLRLASVAPDDRGTPFRRNHRIERILKNVDAVADCNA